MPGDDAAPAISGRAGDGAPRITTAEARRIAELAGLRPDDDALERLAADLSDILDHMAALRAVAIDGVPPFTVAGDRAPLRPDEPGADPLDGAPGKAAPGWADGLFTVPRLRSHAGEEGQADTQGPDPRADDAQGPDPSADDEGGGDR
ncbi:MAG: Asp-tRNA(Asn)/Glu-tRNA(Gln) amidotransferase subunit GatC [Longimicrobiales bacterium]|nr:Asp-tRNA(Asn)/Glu-tRNA(Gln) amidotransferase subunit GatC [Longimicrobiales bacterium]